MFNNCPFGNHSEPFLWFGSEIEGCDEAVLELRLLAQLDKKKFDEIADLINSELCMVDPLEGR